LLCTNALFLQHAAVCLTSVLINNPELFFEIVVVQRPTEALDHAKLRRTLASFPNQSLVFKTFRLHSDQVLPLNPRAHYTIDTWARLWIHDFFPEYVNRVLYLDSDIVVIGDIAPLWNEDLGGALLGTVDLPGSDRGVNHLGLNQDDGYF